MARSIFYIGIFAMLGALVAPAAAVVSGFGTAYTDAGQFTPNACGYGKSDLTGHFATYFASIASADWHGGSVCGRCVRVYGDESGATGAGVLFKIIDECASGCGSGSLDFSRTGLEATTGFTWDQKKIVWEWAPCDAAKVLYGARGRSRKGSSKKHKGRKMLDAAEQQA